MTSLRRAFLAVVPPPAVLRWTESVADSARGVDDGLRWSATAQRHLTLQFLGRVADVESLTESVVESVRGIAPFTLQLGGAGAFPSPRRASVLWLGVSTGAEELGALAGAVGSATARLGFAADDRPLRPHLTLGRANRPSGRRALVERLGTGPAGPLFTVEEVVLFESDTRAEGAVHVGVARMALGGVRDPR